MLLAFQINVNFKLEGFDQVIIQFTVKALYVNCVCRCRLPVMQCPHHRAPVGLRVWSRKKPNE